MSDNDEDKVVQLDDPHTRTATALVGIWLKGLSQSARMDLSHWDASRLRDMVAEAIGRHDNPRSYSLEQWSELVPLEELIDESP